MGSKVTLIATKPDVSAMPRILELSKKYNRCLLVTSERASRENVEVAGKMPIIPVKYILDIFDAFDNIECMEDYDVVLIDRIRDQSDFVMSILVEGFRRYGIDCIAGVPIDYKMLAGKFNTYGAELEILK